MYKYINANEIDSKYVGSDCAQIMVPFNRALSIFSETDLTFYGRGYRENKIDNTHYIEDVRKLQFPYNDIPYHWTRKCLDKYLYVNQLFNFNKTYILINNGILIENYVTQKDDKFYLIQTGFALDDKDAIIKKYIEKERVYDFFGEITNNNDGKKTFILDFTGKHFNICFDKNEREQKINELIEFLKQKKMFGSFDGCELWYGNGDFILEDNFMIPIDKPVFMIKLGGNDIQIKYIKLSNINEDIVKVIYFDIPVERYNLQQISEIVKNGTEKLKEPIFSKRLEKRKNRDNNRLF